MKYFVFALVTVMATLSFAHIEKGTWKGTASPEADCYMEVGETTFLGNLRHPLNERISIKIGSMNYSVRHPEAIDTESGKITFNHDLFEGVTATSTGAYAVQIKMVHSEKFEGPESFIVMEDNWKDGKQYVVNCKNIKKVY